ncbi:MAG: hypothetical protein IT376_00880 [Polyangiaceae bacterium]|nr:hypothetical protein [Polyangiaceae bacterium]
MNPAVASRCILPVAGVLAWAQVLRAEPAGGPGAGAAAKPAEARFDDRLAHDSGKIAVDAPVEGELRFQVHGEYQLRYATLSELPLRPHPQEPEATTLGQESRLYHWLRITPRLTWSDSLALVAQADLPYGLIAADPTLRVEPDRDPLDETDPLRLELRALYLEWRSPIGLFRGGRQTSHWGMGLLANDGDHPTPFGDAYRGSITDRALFATRPLGESSPFNVAIAGDWVARDGSADRSKDETAYQGVLALFYEDDDKNRVGVYGVYRTQDRPSSSLGVDFDETLRVWVVDSAGRASTRVSGVEGWLYGEYEVAYVFGDTNFTRTVSQTYGNEREDVSQVGAAARVGLALTKGQGETEWGWLVPQLEWGWASGDANPNDGVTKRFRFDPNYNVGLVLFDEVLRWKTARAASIVRDPDLVQRPPPGTDLLPTNGSVSGATYLYPTFVMRPVPELDLKAGVLVAQATSDVVDPIRLGTTGQFANWDGGDATRRDLGLELDLGVEYRWAVGEYAVVQAGGQAGVLFPGNAFADATGTTIGTQYIGVGRLGVQY